MHFSRENSEANLIVALEADRVKIRETWYSGSIIVTTDKIVAPWQVGSELTVEQLAPAIELAPEIILVGIGPNPGLPDVELIAALAERGIGLEMMDRAAACRTYNVLIHEYRHVVAALIDRS